MPGKTENSPVSIAMISDNTLLRQLIEFRLSVENEFLLNIALPYSAAAALAATRTHPDVTILTPNSRIPDADTMQLISEVRCSAPDCHVITLAQDYLPEHAALLTRMGVSGIVLESLGWESLLQAVRTVHAGGVFTPRSVTRFARDGTHGGKPELRLKDIELLRLVSQGLSNSDIAGHLNVSESTVRSRLGTVVLKLNVRNRTQAVTEGIRLGYIELHPVAEGSAPLG